MRIAILVEGKTEVAFMPSLRSVQACSELKAFINTILALCEGELIP